MLYACLSIDSKHSDKAGTAKQSTGAYTEVTVSKYVVPTQVETNKVWSLMAGDFQSTQWNDSRDHKLNCCFNVWWHTEPTTEQAGL